MADSTGCFCAITMDSIQNVTLMTGDRCTARSRREDVSNLMTGMFRLTNRLLSMTGSTPGGDAGLDEVGIGTQGRTILQVKIGIGMASGTEIVMLAKDTSPASVREERQMTGATWGRNPRSSGHIAGRYIRYQMGVIGVVGQNKGGMANRTCTTTNRHGLGTSTEARSFVRTSGSMAISTSVMTPIRRGGIEQDSGRSAINLVMTTVGITGIRRIIHPALMIGSMGGEGVRAVTARAATAAICTVGVSRGCRGTSGKSNSGNPSSQVTGLEGSSVDNMTGGTRTLAVMNLSGGTGADIR